MTLDINRRFRKIYNRRSSKVKMSFLTPSGLKLFRIRRISLGFCLICLAAFIASASIKKLTQTKVRYDFLQDHIELTFTPIAHIWKPPYAGAERGRSLSDTDRKFISQTLMAMDQGQKIWAGQIIVEGQALKDFNARKDAWDKCQVGQELCRLSLRLDRVFTPRHVHGDLRVVNIEERSQKIDFITDAPLDANASTAPKTDISLSNIKLNKMSVEVRNLRFVKRRNGWALRTIDVLSSKIKEQADAPFVPMQKFVGINYYPASASWRDFWTTFPRETIQADLERISDLGGNSLRIFLTHSTFTDPATARDAKLRLVEFMDMAQKHNLKVIPTFFDLRPDYRIDMWDTDIAFLKLILPLIQDHPALLAIDLKNQIDLDIPLHGAGLIEGWIMVMREAVRDVFPHIPVTVGFSNSKAAIAYGHNLDILSYHDYEPVEGFSTRLAQVQAAYPDRPIWISEIGSSVWAPVPLIGPSAQKQATRLSQQLSAARNVNGIFLWTLNDFDRVSSDIVGWQPWRKKQQAHYGLYDLEGTPRPSAQVFSDFAQRQTGLHMASE